jgi:hypothetical protein
MTPFRTQGARPFKLAARPLYWVHLNTCLSTDERPKKGGRQGHVPIPVWDTETDTAGERWRSGPVVWVRAVYVRLP